MKKHRLLFLVLAVVVFLLTAASAAAKPLRSDDGGPSAVWTHKRYIEAPGNYRGFTYYSEFGAILRDIAMQAPDRVYSLKTVGFSAGGPTTTTQSSIVFNLNGSHPLWNVVVTWPMNKKAWKINMDFRAALTSNPNKAGKMLKTKYAGTGMGKKVLGSKVIRPVYFLNCSIHGGEQPGADAGLKLLRRLAFQNDSKTKSYLKKVIVVIDPVQNPDGRINGTRGNGNGFDCNRDFITLTQPETVITAATMRKWLPETMFDLHTSSNPLLVEPTTLPQNPMIEYDLTFGNQIPMGQYTADSLATQQGQPYTIPYFWGTALDLYDEVNEGWDGYAPYYTPQLAQQYGSAAFTVETNYATTWDGVMGHYTISKAGLDYTASHARELVKDHVNYMKRGFNSVAGGRPWQNNVKDMIRAAVFDPITNSSSTQYIAGGAPGFPYSSTVGDVTFPFAYIVPVDPSMQRQVLGAYKLLNRALWYGVTVLKAKKSFAANGVTYPAGTFIVPMKQALRGLANNLLWDGEDVKAKYGVSSMYDISAWSLKYAYGIDAPKIDASFKLPTTEKVKSASVDTVINNYNSESDTAGPVGLDQVPMSIKRTGTVTAGTDTVFWWKGDSIIAARVANECLKFGFDTGMVTRSIAAPYNTIPLGAFVVSFSSKPWAKGLINQYANKWGVDFTAAPGLVMEQLSKLARPNVVYNADANTIFVLTQMLGFQTTAAATSATLAAANDFYYSTSSGDTAANISTWLANSSGSRTRTYWAAQSANSQANYTTFWGTKTTYTIGAITAGATSTQITTTAPNALAAGDYVVLSGTNSTPTINRTYKVMSVIDASNFTIGYGTTANGTAGTVTVPYVAVAVDRSSADNGYMRTKYAQDNIATAGYTEDNLSFAYPPYWFHNNGGGTITPGVAATFEQGATGSFLQGFWNYPCLETVGSPSLILTPGTIASAGKGTIVSSGFNPTYRGYQDNTAMLVARAAFLSNCTPPSVP